MQEFPSEMIKKYQNETDEMLIERLRDGERDIMDYIMNKYKNLVRSKAKSMYILGADTEDLIQEGRLGILSALSDYDSAKNDKFYPFAKLCVDRRIMRFIEASNAKKHTMLNESVSITPDDEYEKKKLESDLAVFTDNPEILLIEEERVNQLIDKAENVLTSFEKKVFMHMLKGDTYKQIAKLMNRDSKSIDNAIQRIRKKLK